MTVAPAVPVREVAEVLDADRIPPRQGEGWQRRKRSGDRPWIIMTMTSVGTDCQHVPLARR